MGTTRYSNMGTVGTELGTENANASIFSKKMMGLERFELSSVTPEATSLDQASRQPLQIAFRRLFLRVHRIMLA